MENKTIIRAFIPIITFFIIINALLTTMRPALQRWNIDSIVLLIGNVVLFAATAVSFYLYYRSLRTKNAMVFIRMIYSGILIKMMSCLVAVFIYAGIYGRNVNKGAVFGCLFLYFVYTFVEVAIVMKLSKRNKNA